MSEWRRRGMSRRACLFWAGVVVAVGGCDWVSGLSEFRMDEGGAGGTLGGGGFSDGGTGDAGGAAGPGGGGGGGACAAPCSWLRAVTGDAAVTVRAVVPTADSGMVAALHVAGPTDLDPLGFSSTSIDARVVSLGPDGLVRWVQLLHGGGETIAEAAVVDAAGDVVVVGSFGGALRLGPQDEFLEQSAGARDMFVVKLRGQDGSLAWSRSFGTDRDQVALAVAIGDVDRIVVGGSFADSLAFGSDILSATTNNAELDGFVAILDGHGDPLRAVDLGAPNGDSLVTHLAVRPQAIWAGGRFTGNLSLPGETLASNNFDAFFVPLDPLTLAPGAALHFTGAGHQRAGGLASTPDGIAGVIAWTNSLAGHGIGLNETEADSLHPLVFGHSGAAPEVDWFRDFSGVIVASAGQSQLSAAGEQMLLVGGLTGSIDLGRDQIPDLVPASPQDGLALLLSADDGSIAEHYTLAGAWLSIDAGAIDAEGLLQLGGAFDAPLAPLPAVEGAGRGLLGRQPFADAGAYP